MEVGKWPINADYGLLQLTLLLFLHSFIADANGMLMINSSTSSQKQGN